METNTNKNLLDESNVSRDASLTISDLSDSHRSGEEIMLSPGVGTAHFHQVRMGETGQRRITPASSRHNDPNLNVSSRMKEKIVPPLPIMVDASARHISPATPMPPQVALAGKMRTNSPPSSAQSHDSRTLAALYQCSRRSRNNTPATPGKPTIGSSSSSSMYPPPPPLFSAGSRNDSDSQRGLSLSVSGERDTIAGGTPAVASSDIQKVSLQSSYTSSMNDDSWRESMSSLMNTSSFINSSFNGSFNTRSPINAQGQFAPITAITRPVRRTREQPRKHGRPSLMDYKIEDNSNVEEDDNEKKAPPEAIPTWSGDSSEEPPARTQSPHTETLEKLSSLQVRTREEFEEPVPAEGNQGAREKGGSTSMEEDNLVREAQVKAVNDASSDNDDDNSDSKGRPKKKYKKRLSATGNPLDYDAQTPETPNTHRSTASFDLIAHPSSRSVSSIQEGEISPTTFRDMNMDELLHEDLDVTDLYDLDAEKDHEMGVRRMQEEARNRQETTQRMGSEAHVEEEPQDYKVQGDQEETASEKYQRILRRKIQRLLLIRHCSTCPVPANPSAENIPPLPLVTAPGYCGTCNDDGNSPPPPRTPQEGTEAEQAPARSACPVTSHCAEGKALCAHIRKCKLENCKYKKCLTSREVLGHYKSCRNRLCEICGPVRALDRRHKQCHGGGHDVRKPRRRSDSSIETIDDEGWLNENMMANEHAPISGNPERMDSS